MSEKLILEKLDSLEKQSNKLDVKVDKIEVAVGLIAVQSERITTMQGQIQSLWGKYDEAFGTEGTISNIKQFQANCPREEMKTSCNRLWAAMGLLASMLIGAILKILNT